MYQHFLLPTDGSELSAQAVQDGVALAAKLGARVTALHVIPRFHASSVMMELLEASKADYVAAAEAWAKRHLEAVSAAAAAAKVPCEVAWVTSDDPALAIVDTARERGCDLIVMASHGRRGMRALLLGSETQKVLTHSQVPVLVHRGAGDAG